MVLRKVSCLAVTLPSETGSRLLWLLLMMSEMFTSPLSCLDTQRLTLVLLFMSVWDRMLLLLLFCRLTRK